MNEFQKFSVGEPLRASRLNELVDYARPPYAGIPGYGGHIFGSQYANANAGKPVEPTILVYATEGFELRTTDHNIEDDVESGLCDFVRLNQSSNIHENGDGEPFPVWDALGSLTGSESKVSGDIFYAVWNFDSKRWEALSSQGIRLQAATVLQCLGRGWHEIELCEWNGRPTFYDSVSESISASESCDYNDLESGSNSKCRMPCDVEPCNTVSDGEVPMDPCTTRDLRHFPNYAHTTRQLPMLTGGLIKVIRRFGDPVGIIPTSASESESESGSASGSDEEPWYYDVVDGVWPIIENVKKEYQVCVNGETGECTVIQTSQQRQLFEGYECPIEYLDTCGGASVSASDEVPPL